MIDETARAYLDLVDEVRPGYVRGLYLVGSAALGAWQPARSDVDTVILTSRPAGAGDLDALAGIHAQMPVQPCFDGVYIEPGLAGSWPADRRAVPFVVRGEFTTGKPCGELTPVLWLTLQRHGIRVRGPAVAGFGRGNGARMGVCLGPRTEPFVMINVRGFGSHLEDVGG